MPRSTPLADLARHHHAQFTTIADTEIPARFGECSLEYAQARGGAALFDISHLGKLELTGKDAPSFLHNLTTNDINNLPLGGGCEAYCCDHRAKVLYQLNIYHVLSNGQHAFWLDVTPGLAGQLFQHFDKHIISEQVEMMDLTDSYAMMHLAGPGAKSVLEKALGAPVPDLDEFLHMERAFSPKDIGHIRRHDTLGLPGYDIVAPNASAGAIARLLVNSGAQLAGHDTYDTLRIENNYPVYGLDIGPDRFVMEVARALRAVSYQKGCYLGQEPIVMARDRAGFVNRAQMLVKVHSNHTLPPGTKLFRDQSEVGLTTSSVVSPNFGAPIAMAYLRRGHQDPGLYLRAETPTGPITAEVLPA